MIDALTDDQLRLIVARSRDERVRRAARRALNSRSSADTTAPRRLAPRGAPPWAVLEPYVAPRVAALVARGGAAPSLAELADAVDDALVAWRAAHR